MFRDQFHARAILLAGIAALLPSALQAQTVSATTDTAAVPAHDDIGAIVVTARRRADRSDRL